MPNHDENFHSDISNESIRLIASPSIMAKKAFLYMLEMGYLETDYSYLQELDNVDSFLFLFTISGEGKLEYDGKEYTLTRDQLFLIDCKKYYYCGTPDPKEWMVLYMYFNGYQAKEYYKMIVKNHNPVFTTENPKAITSMFWQIVGLHKKKNNYSEMLTSLHITKLLTEIALIQADTTSLETEYPDYLNAIFYYIKRNYTTKITLDMLAEKFTINKYHLEKVFKRYSGTTINEYVIMNRMDKAKALLRYTNKSVDEIANEVGFYNASHFIKMFREREHVTPLNYKKLFVKLK